MAKSFICINFAFNLKFAANPFARTDLIVTRA